MGILGWKAHTPSRNAACPSVKWDDVRFADTLRKICARGCESRLTFKLAKKPRGGASRFESIVA